MHHFWNVVSTPWALKWRVVAFSAGGDGGRRSPERPALFATASHTNALSPDPTHPAVNKVNYCDRHHIGSAMAELPFHLSSVPHVRSFDCFPTLPDSAPRERGFFVSDPEPHVL